MIVGDSPQALIGNLSVKDGRRLHREPPSRGVRRALGEPALHEVHRLPVGRDDVRRHCSLHARGRPLDAEPRLLQSRRGDPPAGSAGGHGRLPRPDRDRRLARCPEEQRRGQRRRLRALRRSPVPRLPQHRLAERERLPDLEGSGGRCGRPRGRARNPLCRPGGAPDRRAQLPQERAPATMRVGEGSSSSTRRTRTSQPTPRCSRSTSDGRRCRSSCSRPATSSSRTSPRSPMAARRRLRRQEYWTALSGATGPVLREPLHLAVRRRLEAQPRYRGKRAARLPRQPLREQAAGSGSSPISRTGSSRRATEPSPRTATSASSDYVTTAATQDGRLAISYLPIGGTIRVA